MPLGKTVTVSIGAYSHSFTLSSAAEGGDANNTLQVAGKLKAGVFTSTAATVKLTVKNQNLLSALGFGVTWDFIVKGIQAGKLEYRDGAIWGNPYLKILRNQLTRSKNSRDYRVYINR